MTAVHQARTHTRTRIGIHAHMLPVLCALGRVANVTGQEMGCAPQPVPVMGVVDTVSQKNMHFTLM